MQNVTCQRRRRSGRERTPARGHFVKDRVEPVLVLVNAQEFTKTANCWGVTNNSKGTNTNRVVVFRKRA
ncbi:MAG: hypothetical protein ACRD15_01630 [Vicinamibacterales bacterium]